MYLRAARTAGSDDWSAAVSAGEGLEEWRSRVLLTVRRKI